MSTSTRLISRRMNWAGRSDPTDHLGRTLRAAGRRQEEGVTSDMEEKEAVAEAYREMYRAMVQKDRAGLEAVLADSFTLVHMTGMRQSKNEFIQAVMDGTLNYYSVLHENISVAVTGDTASLTGQSLVTAAVFGGRRSRWRLQQKCTLKKAGGRWRFTKSMASTY